MSTIERSDEFAVISLSQEAIPQSTEPKVERDYVLILRDRNLNVIRQIWPIENEITPGHIRWTRSFRDIGKLELSIHRTAPQAGDLLTIGNVIEVQREGVFEAAYVIVKSTINTASTTYSRDAVSHNNAYYVAGQGEGTARDVVLRTHPNSISAFMRLEAFLDRRDLPAGDFDALRLAADALLMESSLTSTVLTEMGKLRGSLEEAVSVVALDPKFYLSRRLIIPPPASVNAETGIVDISTSDLQTETGAIDVVMKKFVQDHVTAPVEAARTIPNISITADVFSPVVNITQTERFRSVLEALEEIGNKKDVGCEFSLVSGPSLEFQPIQETDKTASVVFSDTDTMVDTERMPYRAAWDLGDKVTLGLSALDLDVQATIIEISHELSVGKPVGISIAFNREGTSEGDSLTRRLRKRLQRAADRV